MTGDNVILYSSILLIEDDPDDRDLFIRVINAIGNGAPIEVRTAPNGADGLKLLQQKTPDIIFSDVNMPVMDGFQFALAVYDHFPSLKVPIVFMSTANLHRDIVYAEMLNVIHYIRKPGVVSELEKEVLQVLSNRYLS